MSDQTKPRVCGQGHPNSTLAHVRCTEPDGHFGGSHTAIAEPNNTRYTWSPGIPTNLIPASIVTPHVHGGIWLYQVHLDGLVAVYASVGKPECGLVYATFRNLRTENRLSLVSGDGTELGWASEWNGVHSGPAGEDEDTSAVSVPTEPGNASERPNQAGETTTAREALDAVIGGVAVAMAEAGKNLRRNLETVGLVPIGERPNAGHLGDLYAESTDSVYVHDAVNGLWTGFERADGEDLYEDELPDDAAPLHGITHNIYDVREIERLRVELTAEQETSAHHMRYAAMREAERDEARAKLDQVRGEIAKLDDWHGRRVDLPFVELMRMIVGPEATQEQAQPVELLFQMINDGGEVVGQFTESLPSKETGR